MELSLRLGKVEGNVECVVDSVFDGDICGQFMEVMMYDSVNY